MAAPPPPPPPPPAARLKRSFKERKRIAAFYAGGPVVQARNETVLCATSSDVVNLVSLATGQVVGTLPGDTEPVTSLAVDSTAARVAIASRSLQVRVLRVETQTVERAFKALNVPVVAMDIDPTDVLLAVGGSDGTLRIWDIDKAYCTHNLKGHKAPITCVLFHHDQNRWTLYSASADGDVRAWDLMTSKCTATLKGHVSAVAALSLSPTGNQLVSAGRDQVLNVWDLYDHTLTKTIPVLETLEAVGYAPSELFAEILKRQPHDSPALVFTAGDKGVLRIWNLTTGECIAKQATEHNAQPCLYAFFHSGWNAVGVVSLDQTIQYYSLPSFTEVRGLVGASDEIVDVRYVGPAETHLLVATASDKLRLYDTQTFDCRLLRGHSDIVLCVDVSPSGTTVVSGGKDNQVLVWHIDVDTQTVSCVGTAVGHTASVSAVALPKRHASKFFLSGSEDRTVKCWDLSAIALSVGKDGPQRVVTKYTVLAHDKDINTVSVSPNDKLFATGSQDRTAKLWNAADGSLVGVLRGHKRGVWCVSFSPVDQVIATASGDQTIRLWSVKDFSCLKTFEGHQNSVLRVQFLSLGMQLLSTGSDGLAKLWTIKTSECVSTMDAHADKVWALAMKRDESEFVSGSADAVVRLWSDYTQQEVDADIQEQAEQLEQEQELSNLLVRKDYTGAIRMCLKLDQPRRLVNIFTNVIESNADEEDSNQWVTGSAEIDTLLEGLTDPEYERLLGYVRDWNTNSKLSRVAQVILHKLLKCLSPQKFVDMPNAKQLLQALVPYSERHLARLDTLLTRSFIVDYLLRSMDSLEGPPETKQETKQETKRVRLY